MLKTVLSQLLHCNFGRTISIHAKFKLESHAKFKLESTYSEKQAFQDVSNLLLKEKKATQKSKTQLLPLYEYVET